MVSTSTTYQSGDRVVHTKKPEWGPGTVMRAENAWHQGKPIQRLHVKFPGVGTKVMNTAFAPLVAAEQIEKKLDAPVHPPSTTAPPIPVVSRQSAPIKNNGRPTANPTGSTPPISTPPIKTSGWLDQLEKRDPESIMLDIPEVARDPFRTIWDRLGSSFDLFRFAANARGILDWAVAQSGLEDPLTRFNRQELETLFHKWTRLRDLHLLETLEEAVKQNADMARQRLAAAPAEVKQTVRRLHNKR